MSLTQTVYIDDGISLPKFPADASEVIWQSKSLPVKDFDTEYRINGAGRLLRKVEIKREKTSEEKYEEAQKHGFDSWENFKKTVEGADMEEIINNSYPRIVSEDMTEDVEWMDVEYHGSFTFYKKIGYVPAEDREYSWSYEARFTRGTLDDIVFLGERHGPGVMSDDFVDPADVEIRFD